MDDTRQSPSLKRKHTASGDVKVPPMRITGIGIVSTAASTAAVVAPNYAELWRELGAEFTVLQEHVLRGVADGSIPWKRVGISSHLIEQLQRAHSQTLQPAEVFKTFAQSELDRRNRSRTSLQTWAKIILGGGGVGAIVGALITLWLID